MNTLPPDILTHVLYPMLKSKEVARLGRCSRFMHQTRNFTAAIRDSAETRRGCWDWGPMELVAHLARAIWYTVFAPDAERWVLERTGHHVRGICSSVPRAQIAKEMQLLGDWRNYPQNTPPPYHE